MKLCSKKVTFAITNCVYRFERILEQIKSIIEDGAEIVPILSSNALINENIVKYKGEIEKLAKNRIITSYDQVNKIESDIIIIAPCNRKYHW